MSVTASPTERSVEDETGLRRFDAKVSVIVPFYNVQMYLAECIQSVIVQDYKDLEILLIDDASPDQSRMIAERFAAQDHRVQIISHEKNRGLGPARNTGVINAIGTYIFFLDSDDFLSSSNAITRLVSAAQDSGCRVIVGSCEKLTPDGSHQPADHADDKGALNEAGGVVRSVDAFLASVGLPNSYYLPRRAWGVLIDRGFYRNQGLEFPPGEHEDLSLVPFLYFLSGGVLYLKDIVVAYRLRGNSISSSPWSSEKVLRYGELWQDFKANVVHCKLETYVGDAALSFISHLIWRMENNGFDEATKAAAVDVITTLFQDVKTVTYREHFYKIMDYVRGFFGTPVFNAALNHRLTQSISTRVLLEYYCNQREFGAALRHLKGKLFQRLEGKREVG